MIPINYKIEYDKIKRAKYDCENDTYHKYGKDIKIKDFVNAGRDGTETKNIIGKTVSMDELKRICKEIPTQSETINLNLNPYMANKIMKTAKIEYDKIIKLKEEAEAEAKKTNSKGRNNK